MNPDPVARTRARTVIDQDLARANEVIDNAIKILRRIMIETPNRPIETEIAGLVMSLRRT